MTERSIAHGSFTVERTYPVPPARAFKAWSDPKQKARWFGSPQEGNPKHVFEFRVGGREYTENEGPGGANFTFDVRYYDIVENERIVYTYDMTMDGPRISVSMATIEFSPESGGTRMTITEHGAFLDGLDTVAQREAGTNWLADQLGEYLKADA
jgi:uncharacterized protein YndB with AHSA1/START domain